MSDEPQRHNHIRLLEPEFAFNKKATTGPNCLECWATGFRCPCCGLCTNGMVMTTKCCLLCGISLIRITSKKCVVHDK